MKLLKISDNVGQFLSEGGEYLLIDKIAKNDLLRLVNKIIDEDEVEMDLYDEQALRNQAHQVIYKSIYQKLAELRGRRQEFIDEAARLFIEDYEKYRE